MTSDFKHPMAWHDEPQAEGVFIGPADDPGPTLLNMPVGVKPRRGPSLSEEAANSEKVRELLHTLVGSLQSLAEGGATQRFLLEGFSEAELALVDETLGTGEVGITCGFDPEYQVRESVMAGLWRVRVNDAEGQKIADWVEAGDIPGFVREATRQLTAPILEVPSKLPEGTMNVGPVLAEIRERAAAWQAGQRNHVLNFTLLPMTPEDSDFLAKALGRAPLTVVSGGYGTARVHLTGIRNVWAVQYLNSMDTVILDTLEIGDVPGAATAAKEDFEDSSVRLKEILEAYFQ